MPKKGFFEIFDDELENWEFVIKNYLNLRC